MRARGFRDRISEIGCRFATAEEGATAVEYAALMLIAIAIIGALSFFTGTLMGAYQSVVDALIEVMA